MTEQIASQVLSSLYSPSRLARTLAAKTLLRISDGVSGGVISLGSICDAVRAVGDTAAGYGLAVPGRFLPDPCQIRSGRSSSSSMALMRLLMTCSLVPG